MADIEISVDAGTSKRLLTAGKYCDRDILVSASGGAAEPVIQPLEVTANGVYNVPAGVDGYNPVSVNVSGGGGEAGGNVLINCKSQFFQYSAVIYADGTAIVASYNTFTKGQTLQNVLFISIVYAPFSSSYPSFSGSFERLYSKHENGQMYEMYKITGDVTVNEGM